MRKIDFWEALPIVALILLVLTLLVRFISGASAHIPDRPDLDDWVMHLRSKQGGLCCDLTEARKVIDADWDTQDGHYRVFIDGRWWDVPDSSVVTDPNRFGPTLVWPSEYADSTGKMQVIGIRCFLPGAGT